MSTQHSAASRAADAAKPGVVDEFATAVAYYLRLEPRQLPSRYLYDARGSALFDAICELPWYRITRAELGLLEAHRRQIRDSAAQLSRIVELGPGNGAKLAQLLDSIDNGGRPRHSRRLEVHLVDMSQAALAAAALTLSSFDNVDVVQHRTPYEVGLADATRESLPEGRTLVLFLGSNIGNFDPPAAEAFLRGIRATLGPRDLLLVGADLVKPERELLLAYDDPLGVTAAFNRNLLVRINRELGGDFDLGAFAHRAVWNREQSRVEMHLVSRRPQRVRIARAEVDITFAEGETIWTESSYKYSPSGIVALLDATGFQAIREWIDRDAAFALSLGRRV